MDDDPSNAAMPPSAAHAGAGAASPRGPSDAPRRASLGRRITDSADAAPPGGPTPAGGDAPVSPWGPPAAWPDLRVGSPLTIVKRDSVGGEVTRYPGTVLTTGVPPPWLAVEGRWVNRPVDLDGLVLNTGDRLVEYFSPAHPFNAFAVWSPAGALRGWYANVTHPATVDTATNPPTLTWLDLYLDVVALPDGTVTIRDEDELAESNLATTDPALHAAILSACAEIVSRMGQGEAPFHEMMRDRLGESR